LEGQKPDFAYGDVHLLDVPTGPDVEKHLAECGVPCVFVTRDRKRIPEEFSGAIGVIERPYTMHAFKTGLNISHGICAEMSDRPCRQA